MYTRVIHTRTRRSGVSCKWTHVYTQAIHAHVRKYVHFYVRFSICSSFPYLFLRVDGVRLCVSTGACGCAYMCRRACVCVCLHLRAYPYRLVTPLVSSLANRPRLPRSLAHSYFQFASESKGLIKSPQTGFSGISRVNAKEIQPPARPECLYRRPIAYRSTTTACSSADPSFPSQTPLAYLAYLAIGPANTWSQDDEFPQTRAFPSFWRKPELDRPSDAPPLLDHSTRRVVMDSRSVQF